MRSKSDGIPAFRIFLTEDGRAKNVMAVSYTGVSSMQVVVATIHKNLQEHIESKRAKRYYV